MSDANRLREMKDILDRVWMYHSGEIAREEIDKVLNTMKEWIGELER